MLTRLKLGQWAWTNVFQPRLFGREPEDAHRLSVEDLKQAQRGCLWLLKAFYQSPHVTLPTEVFGTVWRNPVCLAAGYDKHAEVIRACEALGFGAVEVGTVTPRPQEGNTQPRLFRYPELEAVINRYGFNSVGARVVAERLKARQRRYRIGIPVGVSIGKNKETPEEKAVDDYLMAFRELAPCLRAGDWVKINISSPNTPQLRDIFTRLPDFLGAFVKGAGRLIDEEGWRWPRLVLKVPPDGLSVQQLEEVVKVCAQCRFKGIEATNTTINEEIKGRLKLTEAGGLSGEPLRELATATLETLKAPAKKYGIDLVGVGGISEGWHAVEKRHAGAKAVQLYTGLIFRGPVLIHEVLEAWKARI